MTSPFIILVFGRLHSFFALALEGVEKASLKFQSPYDVLKWRAEKMANQSCFKVTRLGRTTYQDFRSISWAEVFQKVNGYIAFLNSKGLKPGDCIALHGRNSAEWIFLDWAAITFGVVTVPLYVHSHIDEIRYILAESETKILFSDDHVDGLDIQQIKFVDLEEAASTLSSSQIPPPLDPDLVCSIIYTSGTTGNPKGVMHTARNFFEAITVANKLLKLSPKDQLLSYLPLSHVAERVLIELGCLYTGASVAIVERVERLPQSLSIIRPTVFFGVPRIWDAFRLKIEKEVRSNALLMQRLQSIPFFLRNFILAYFVRKKIGLNRARICLSGAAKLSEQTWRSLKDFGITVAEGYGLTETLCVSALDSFKNPTNGSIGKIYREVDMKLEADGEICLRASFHFKGYFKHPDWSAEVLKDGWFYTGDIGTLDSKGFLRITDRKKDLFKSSSGKFIAPLPIESLLKQHPSIREAVVIGENLAHCIAVASVENDVSEDAIKRHLDFVNSKLPPHEQIKSLGLLRRNWATETGELTPSLKVKRKAVMQIYHREIKELYESSSRVKLF